MHACLQDAHEFLNYLLNQSAEILEQEAKCSGVGATPSAPIKTWVHDIFQGKLVNETRCLNCETVTNRWACSCVYAQNFVWSCNTD